MATTPNYSWIMPDPTDLVKDLPADFAIFGNAVDSTVKTNADAAVTKATVDAKGDLIAGTADNTIARLAVGANDTILTADSSTATGLKWAAPAAAGGITLLSTTTLSGTTTTISGISQAYKNLYYELVGTTSSSGRFFLNPNNTTGNYSGVQSGGAASDTNIISSASNSTATHYAYVSISDYTSSDKHTILNIGSNGGAASNFQGGVHDSAAAITSITITTATGSPTLSGTVKVYGVS
jgi:hypothetical protein